MRFEAIIAAFSAQPLAMLPEKARVISEFLFAKSRGEDPAIEWQAAAKPNGRTTKKQQKEPVGVAVLPVYGSITQRADMFTEWSGGTSTELLGQWVDEAASDPSIEAIVLDMDTPGGGVYGVAEVADKIASVSKQKKVIAVVNSLAASAGYWIASAASEIVMSPNGEVGSIGVFTMHMDQSKSLETSGRSVTVISAGKNKTAGHPYGPLDQQAREVIQKGVDDYYAKFVKAVASGRGVTQTRVREEFGAGGVVRSEQALAEGMVDKIGTLESVLNRYGLGLADLRPAGGMGAEDFTPKKTDHEIEKRKRRFALDQSNPV